MLTIRFSRIGKKKKPFYRLIISEKTKDTWGTFLEQLGHYDPQTKKATLKADRITYWISVGSQMSNSVHNLLVKEGVIKAKDDKKKKSVFISKKRAVKIEKARPQPPKVEEKPASAPAEVVAETPAPEKTSTQPLADEKVKE